ncbi:class I SAM-dependent methyltransferase [Heyndrickxia sp. FSL W8-0423]|uniref:class I SAM-dependent methyltransferase n=1 Tax=Heyndrickxia sp. FSL W8-0423 TaxID=2921601 RepID=UPI0030FA57E5
MTINFQNPDDHFTYARREADSSWIQFVRQISDIKGKRVLDIGCGGGIYTKALADMGALHITCLDFSEKMLSAAKVNLQSYHNIEFKLGNALQTGLPSEQYDIVLIRAVIHHLNDIETCFQEIFRLLKRGGSCMIQDRTPDDCLVEGSNEHIRGYFFTKYPQLVEKETSRRHSGENVRDALKLTGFETISKHILWETRRKYENRQELFDDIINRTGRSILHELNDYQLQDLVDYLKEKLPGHQPIVEKDRWTIWKADKQ